MDDAHRTDPDASTRARDRAPVVLIVEDDAGLTRIYRRQLDRAGFRVLVARSRAVALELIAERERVFDVAVLDIRLPDGNAEDLIGLLLDRSPLCMSLVVTGAADPGLQRRLAQLGAHASLLKPISPNTLVEAVTDTLRATRAWRNLVDETAQAKAHQLQAKPAPAQPDPYVIDIERAVDRIAALGQLSPIQAEVARHMLLGLSDRDIAEALRIQLRTAKYHVSQVIHRTGANGRAGLLAVLLADCG